MRLLVVEDDRDLRKALTELLGQSGYEIHAFADGRQAFQALLQNDYGLAIVDLGLPGMDGITLIRDLRRSRRTLPILVVTARDALDDRVLGLNAGADDYLVKPFEMLELEARVRALLRRGTSGEDERQTIGNLEITPGDPRVRLSGVEVELPASEFALLEVLAARPGKVVSKERIADALARGDDAPSDTAIEVGVHRLRRRLGSHGLQVRTLRGFGYLLEVNDAPKQ